MSQLKVIEAINQALDMAMDKNDKIMLLGEDIGKVGGVFRTTAGLQKKHGEQRVVDTPISEMGIIGTAVGLSLNGFIPVCEIQFDGFLWTGFDQIINHVTRMRSRSRGRFSCPMVIRIPFGGGIHALEHHSESMESVFSHIPGINVVIASNPVNAKGLLLAALESPDPTIFLEPKKVYRAIKTEVPAEYYTQDTKKAVIERQGSQVTIISYGAMYTETKKALAQYIQTNPIDFELIDLISLSPIDYETIFASANKTGKVLIINEENPNCGLAAELSANIHENCMFNLHAPVKRVTGYDVIIPLLKNEYNYIPSTKKIISALDDLIKQ
jgi:pyruvate dehydrogenase E1 component beta subunit